MLTPKQDADARRTAEPERLRILIADDDRISRKLLHAIMEQTFDVDEAVNGREAYDMLRRGRYALLISDICMPEMDGWELLGRLREEGVLAETPVIVVTAYGSEESEVRALNEGATDVIRKPFVPATLLSRAKNTVDRQAAMREAAQSRLLALRAQQQAQHANYADHDELTKLFNRNAFYTRVHEVLGETAPPQAALLVLDIDRFQVYNDLFGKAEGDKLLEAIASELCPDGAEVLACGRLEADRFAVLFSGSDEAVESLCARYAAKFVNHRSDYAVGMRFGAYRVENAVCDAGRMCDRALLALRAAKTAGMRLVWYDVSMRESLIAEQTLESGVRAALAHNEFVAWYQPQYDGVTGALTGAEALVRWRHPTEGILPPIKFIPLMERNGMIARLDEMMREQVCRDIVRWRAAGLRPVPVSVNVSRREFYDPAFRERLCALMDRFGLERAALHLEITETAYMENPQQLMETVHQLREDGFFVEMDDFGSGYSSLNTLKNMPVDLLKLDMRFLADSDVRGRGGIILNSVVHMAQWLNIPVLAEGVETGRQVDYLKTIGCRLFQGYFFAKPMETASFETLLAEQIAALPGRDGTIASFFNTAEFFDPDAQATVVFNTFVGAAGIFEYHGGRLTAQRINDKYYETAHLSREEFSSYRDDILQRIAPQDLSAVREALGAAAASFDEVECELRMRRADPTDEQYWLRIRARCIAKNSASSILYIAFEDITARKVYEARERAENERNRILIERTGTCVFDYDVQRDTLHFHANIEGRGVTTFDVPAYLTHVSQVGNVHPDDAETVRRAIREGAAGPVSGSIDYRADNWGSGYCWCRLYYTSLPDETGRIYRIVGQVENIQAEKEREQLVSGLNRKMRHARTAVLYDTVIVESVFRLLYESTDTEQAVHTILAMLGEHFDVGRAYIFENADDRRTCRNTFEWYAAGAPPRGKKLHGRPLTEASKAVFLRLFGDSGLFCVEDVAALTGPVGETFRAEGVYASIQCEIIENGAFCGLLGFDDLEGPHRWTDGQASTLSLIGMLIGTFLTKLRERKRAAFSEDFRAALDKNVSYIYLVDPETFAIYYNNQAIRDYAGESYEGALCYRQFIGRGSPCDNCPVVEYRKTGRPRAVEVKRGDGRWMLAQASPMNWNGRDMMMVTCTEITEKKRAEEALRVRSEEYRIVVAQSGKHVIRYDIASHTAQFYSGAALFGLPDEVIDFDTRAVEAGVVTADSADAFRAFLTAVANGEAGAGANLRLREKDGAVRWYRADGALLYGEDGKPSHAIVSFYENSAQIEKELAYRRWLDERDALIRDSLVVMEANLTKDSVETQVGMLEYEAGVRPSLPLSQIHERQVAAGSIHPEDVHLWRDFFDRERLCKLFGAGVAKDAMEYRDCHKGDARWVRATVQMTQSPVTDDVEALIAFTDADGQHAAKPDADMASRDAMTNLLTKDGMKRRVCRYIDGGGEGDSFAMFLIDLDSLKRINERLGHRRGDDVLRHMADTLMDTFRTTDAVGRIGGDEFMAFMGGGVTAETVRERAAALIDALQLSVDGFLVTACVGAVIAHGGEANYERMYRLADQALYGAKHSGSGRYLLLDAGDGQVPAQEDGGASRSLMEAVRMPMLLRYIDDGIALVELSGEEARIVDAAAAFRKRMATPAESEGLTALLPLVLPADRDAFQADLCATAQTGTPTDRRVRLNVDGPAQWRRIHAARLPDEAGHDRRLLLVVTDVAMPGREAADAAARGAQRYLQALTGVYDEVIELDDEGGVGTVVHSRSLPADEAGQDAPLEAVLARWLDVGVCPGDREAVRRFLTQPGVTEAAPRKAIAYDRPAGGERTERVQATLLYAGPGVRFLCVQRPCADGD